MRIFLSFLLLTLTTPVLADCSFRKEITKVISLSGPMTVSLKELGLLKKIQGISVFNPVSSEDFSGKIYPGGVFLSPSSLDELKEAVVFFDEGRELRKVFSNRSDIMAREIKSRNLIPLAVIEETLKVLNRYLSGCNDEISSYLKRAKKLEEELVNLIPHKLQAVFYLGELKKARSPDLLMVNDGIVKFLLTQNKLKTYPSSLAYVNWSAKILNTFPQSTFHVGLKDTGREGEIKLTRSANRMTLFYPGALVPGYSQLQAFLYWVKNL